MIARLLAALAVALATAAAAADPDNDFPISFGGPFELVDHTGALRTERDFLGRFMLVQFGYTFCPDVCPLGLTTVTRALELLGERAAAVQPLFISVDPARDTPEQLAAYLAHFHPSLIGLGGSEAQVRAAARAYKVHRRKVVPKDAPEAYLVDHASITYLMGPDGRFVTLFPYGTAPETMAVAIANHLD